MIGVCVVMAGGRGSRMGGVVKPLLVVCGVPLIEHVLGALRRVCARVVIAVSPYTVGALAPYCRRVEVDCVYTSGSGYTRDLSTILALVARRPLLVAPGDALVLRGCLERLVGEALATRAPVATITRSGEPTGFSIFAGDGGPWVNIEASCLRDVDTPEDLAGVEEWCEAMGVGRPEA